MRLARSVLFALIALVLGIGWSSAEVRTIPLGPERSALTLVEQREDGLVYEVEVGNVEAVEVATRAGTFTRLLLPGFHRTVAEGSPELPMLNRLFEIPYGASVRVEVEAHGTQELRLSDYGITHPVFPAQPPVSKSADLASLPFVYDRSAYGHPSSRALAEVVELGTLRAVTLGRLEVSPFAYDPVAGTLRVHDRLTVRLHFAGSDPRAEAARKAAAHSPFFTGLYERIDGYRGEHDLHPDQVRDVVTMAIVTPPAYEAQLADFVAWKRTRGFRVVVGVLGTPEVGTSTTSIKAWLVNLYNNGTEQAPAPSFVLFVGDTGEMPTWIQSGDCTDRPYCAIDGDLMPEMYYGRFSCSNPSNLQAMIDKTMMYDQFTMPDPSYLEKVVMIAGVDSYWSPTHANGQINYGTTQYFNLAHGISSFTHLYPQSGSQDAQIVQEVSDGVGYVNYTAHGSQTSWSDPTFTQANVNGLQNAGKYCLAVGNCCQTSDYDYSSECFAETWLRAANKGAIGYIGGSNSTYWDEDYYWGVGYRTSIGPNPTYDPAHMGAYDGVFHDHGEAMSKWYVTNDALIFCGNLAVTESGSSRTTYYWNIYNLMGDPSLSAYLGVPAVNDVTHPSTIFTTWSSINVTAAPNSYVGLTRNGELLGAGTTDADGNLVLPIFAPPLAPGPAHLCVTAQNHRPYRADVNVIVPAVVNVDPLVMPANTPTQINVSVFEYDGVTPKPGIEVWAEGFLYESEHAFTASDGRAQFMATYPYGPTLEVVGRDPDESWDLFRIPITVTALAMNHPNLWTTTEFGWADSLALNLPGTVHATLSEPGHTLYALQGETILGSTDGLTLDVTPETTQPLQAVLAVSGYRLYRETFPVREAFGTLAGHVEASGPGAGAVVRLLDEGVEVAQAVANAQGDYAFAEEILCDAYTVAVDLFGFLAWEAPLFVQYGPNVLDVELDAAPAGVFTGTVTDAGSGLPLAGTIRVYRTDTGALYAEAPADPSTGVYTTPALPYFDWRIIARAEGHMPQTRVVTLDQPVETEDFPLDPTEGNILVLDDDEAAKGPVPAKLDEKTGALLAPGYEDEGGKAAAADIAADLEALGYAVTVEPIGSDPATWDDYDLVVVACGANANSLNPSVKGSLIQYVHDSGRLLVEGGEVGYDHYGDSGFAAEVLHVTGWGSDSGGNVTVALPSHPVMSVPNEITGPIPVTSGYANCDAMSARADAVVAGSWSSQAGKSSVLCFDPNSAPAGGAIVFFSFNYSAMEAQRRSQLLQNAVVWLLTPEVGDASVSGRVTLTGASDHSGVKVQAIPYGGVAYTDALGAYTLPGLFGGSYTITVSKTGWGTKTRQVSLLSGQQMTGVDFTLLPVFEDCRLPNLPIVDNQTTTDVMPVSIGAWAELDGVEVYVNLSHTYIGDLVVKIRSPQGTEVVLHNRSGGTTDNLVGWYPSQLTPSQPLTPFVGQAPDGNWTFSVSDQAGGDSGTMNEWCLRLAYAGDALGAPDNAAPAVLALRPPQPNPASGTVGIRFDLPARGEIDLAVFDVTGRRVATLLSGAQEAGSYAANWAGRDETGRAVPSGAYFCRLQAQGHVLTEKLLILRGN